MKKIRKILLPLVSISCLLLVWQWVSKSGLYTEAQLPGPVAVAKALQEVASSGVLWDNILASMKRLGIAYGLAIVTAIPLGLILGWYKTLSDAFNPLIQLLRPISPIAWFPLAVLWFKVGDPPAIFIVYLASFFPILLATIAAVKNIDPHYIRIARNYGSNDWQLMTKIAIPAAFPYIVVGLHMALGTAWIHLVAGEMLGVQSGLGYMIVDARNFLRTDLIIGGMVVVGVLGLALNVLMNWLENAINRNWGKG